MSFCTGIRIGLLSCGHREEIADDSPKSRQPSEQRDEDKEGDGEDHDRNSLEEAHGESRF